MDYRGWNATPWVCNIYSVHAILNGFRNRMQCPNQELFTTSAFFSTHWLLRYDMWKCIWFPIVSAMHIHHIGVFIIFIKMKDVVAFIQWLHGFIQYVSRCTIPPNEDSSKSIPVQTVFLKPEPNICPQRKWRGLRANSPSFFFPWYFTCFFFEVLDNLFCLRFLFYFDCKQ